jgi:hypothetical protein
MNERRGIIKQLGLAAWLTPIARSVILPAHASATSGEFITLIALQKGSNEILPADHPGLPKQP